ncbi:hypothetical protein Trydic_g19966 [Trypoxylus dichotomus]
MDDLAREYSSEMTELTKRKKVELEELTERHAYNFAKMKDYFGNIVLNSWALIGTLKERMEVLRIQNECLSAEVENATRNRENLLVPLRRCRKEIAYYREVLQNRQRDKMLLTNAKTELKAMRSNILDLRIEHCALEYRYDRLVVEKKELDTRFLRSILEVHRRQGLKNALLDKRMEVLDHEREVFECVFGEVRRREKRTGQNEAFKRIINAKNDTIHTLKYDIAKARKAHHDLIANYEEVLDKYMVTNVELGFKPLRILPKIFKMERTVH